MQTNILWTGREYYSLENCHVNTTDKGSEINSVIIGKYNEKIYKVAYRIITTPNWETLLLKLESWHSNKKQHFRLESDSIGNWKIDGQKAPQFENCIDIDLSLSPFSNTLPINRLKMKVGKEEKIKVIYFDLLERQIKPVHQKYKRLSDTEYLYQNVPNDFEAKIQVDESGFVVDYPGLFERTAVLKAQYS